MPNAPSNGSVRRASDDDQSAEVNVEKTGSSETLEPNAVETSPKGGTDAIPRIKIIQQGGEITIQLDCDDPPKGAELLIKATGAEDIDFLQNILLQLADASLRDRAVDESKLNGMLSTLRAQKPRNQSDAILAVQMALMHDSAMNYGRRLNTAETIQEVDCYGNVVNKLMRTYAGHADVLQRSRSGNEQIVTVQNVSVSEGGQAIVGNVTQNSSDNDNVKVGSTPAAIADAHTTPMPILEESALREKAPAKRRPRR